MSGLSAGRFRSLGHRWPIRLSLPQLPQRFRGGSIERTVEYLKQLYADYRQVMIDTAVECRRRPLKASAYGGLIAGTIFCMATNPDENDLRQQLNESQNLLLTVPETILNGQSRDHLLAMTSLVNEKLLNYQSFGVFSVLYLTDSDINSCLYSNQCSYLRPTLSSYFTDRVVDIGFVGKFRRLDTKMIDYDINQNEWPLK